MPGTETIVNDRNKKGFAIFVGIWTVIVGILGLIWFAVFYSYIVTKINTTSNTVAISNVNSWKGTAIVIAILAGMGLVASLGAALVLEGMFKVWSIVGFLFSAYIFAIMIYALSTVLKGSGSLSAVSAVKNTWSALTIVGIIIGILMAIGGGIFIWAYTRTKAKIPTTAEAVGMDTQAKLQAGKNKDLATEAEQEDTDINTASIAAELF